ncbi:MAG: FAD:protein FMN transferase [Dehalococcoidia bacterium]|nr:FAD:protein FMN transferase [Dehalococcoidia bacterium]
MERSFRAMNTEWWIRADAAVSLDEAETLVRDVEARLTRFRPDSALSRLNRERRSADPMLATVVARALELRAASRGAFDIGVGQALVDAGYDRSFEAVRDCTSDGGVRALEASRGATVAVRVADGEVVLEGLGLVDLGGIGKGWAVDEVAAWLEARGVESYVVDGGGDIRVRAENTPWRIGVGDAQAIELRTGAVCTSSTRKRRWKAKTGEFHHIVDPRTGTAAACGLSDAVVVAAEASTADALATAVLVSPGDALAATEVRGGAAMVRDGAGTWRMTTGMTRYLR